jgi:hypothetical protein
METLANNETFLIIEDMNDIKLIDKDLIDKLEMLCISDKANDFFSKIMLLPLYIIRDMNIVIADNNWFFQDIYEELLLTKNRNMTGYLIDNIKFLANPSSMKSLQKIKDVVKAKISYLAPIFLEEGGKIHAFDIFRYGYFIDSGITNNRVAVIKTDKEIVIIKQITLFNNDNLIPIKYEDGIVTVEIS